jgi:hypothetical protein
MLTSYNGWNRMAARELGCATFEKRINGRGVSVRGPDIVAPEVTVARLDLEEQLQFVDVCRERLAKHA